MRRHVINTSILDNIILYYVSGCFDGIFLLTFCEFSLMELVPRIIFYRFAVDLPASLCCVFEQDIFILA